nr:hypothetical protein [Tanacetum cinerariifolium]GFA68120.1 hypothetical protein [Tanacetum cinerariifolium]
MMSSPNHPTFKIEDAFSSNFLDYVLASLKYFLASPGNTSPESSNDFTKYLLAILVFPPLHDMEVMQAYDAINELPIPPLQAPIASPTVVPSVLSLFDSRDFFPPEEISPPKDVKTPVESSIPVSPSSSVGSSSPVRSIKGNVTASKPQTLEEAITITHRLMEQVIEHNSGQETNDHKQKSEDKRNTTTNNNNYPNDHNNNNHSNNRNNNNYKDNQNINNCNNDYHQHQNRRHETFRTYTTTNGYTGNCPLYERCTLHHIGPCIAIG